MDVEKIIRTYIDKTIHMSVATVSGDSPWVCELHFVYDQDLNLYFRSLESRRHSQEIAINPKVAGNIVAQHVIDDDAHGIYFEGNAEKMIDTNEIESIVPLFRSRLQREDDILGEAQTVEGHKFYKVTVKTWYAFGKFDNNKADKYTLLWNGKKSAQ